jgi:hypothetical protein
MSDLISRQAAINALDTGLWGAEWDKVLATAMLKDLPSAQPERMTNRQWIDFLSAQFDISRTSAKEMLHGMMQWKKEDNFKKMFNGGRRVVKHEI